MSLDVFLKKKYDENFYNCAHFVADVWFFLYKQNITTNLEGFLLPVKERKANLNLKRLFIRLDKPKEPCIVLMSRHNGSPHVGIYKRRKVFHIRREGVAMENLRIATFGFKKIRFYDVEKSYNSA